VTTSAYLFAGDLLDEGISVVLERLADAGLDGVSMAAAYHHARDVLPHNPLRKLVYLEGGVAYFHADAEHYARIRPHRSALTADGDPLATLAQAARERDMHVSAWVVVLHNTRLAMAYPDCAPRTAFGDPLLHALCPANPDARAYAVALASDAARYGLEAIKLEAVHYPSFDHGGHHERSFVPLSPNARFLLGVCFCTHCIAAAHAAGVDAERLRVVCREQLDALFVSANAETHELEIDDAWLRALGDGQLGRFAEVRQRVVSTLVEEIAAAIHAVSERTRVIYLDPSGATLGYATGRPSTQRATASVGWRAGIDLPGIAGVVDGLGMLGYFAEADRLDLELTAYRGLHRNLEVILRPTYPDTTSAGQLADRVALVRRAGARDLSFYHYGFMRLEQLDWIRQALA
jgi:hypothetical protein